MTLQFFWVQHQIGVITFLFVILIIALSNIRILRNLGDYLSPEQFPKISVMVPARNEENNIGNCVRSLLSQDYPDFQVLVLDDNSTDNTWQILAKLAEENKRLIILKGKMLPPDWLGKHWACHQLALTADGELYLFTDADTIHHPYALRDSAAALIALKADLLTAFPHEEVASWSERLTVPLFPWFILCFLPLFLAYRLRSPAFSAGIGQFMLFRRKAYEQIGGYEAVRQEAVDDVSLARRIKAQGLRWRMINGGDRISCRMYHNFREAYQGFSKNLFAGFGYRILRFVLVWLWLGIAFLQPLFVMFIGIIGVYFSSLSIILAAIGVFISLLIWGASHQYFGFPLYLTFLYPVSMMLALLIAASSMLFALAGKTSWKGRGFIRSKVRWW